MNVPPRVDVEVGKSLDQSSDAYGDGETPASRRAVRLDLGGRNPAEVWALMKREAEFAGGAKHHYMGDLDEDIIDQTSNSVVAASLRRAGISPADALPAGLSAADLPGIRNDLTRPMPRPDVDGPTGGPRVSPPLEPPVPVGPQATPDRTAPPAQPGT